MREILFKGKPDKNHDFAKLLPNEYAKDWVWGSYIKYEDIHVIAQRDCKQKNIIPNLLVNIKPETICEYTGLTDMNGVKIFENDIIEIKHKRRSPYVNKGLPIKNGRIARVVYNEKPAQFGIKAYKIFQRIIVTAQVPFDIIDEEDYLSFDDVYNNQFYTLKVIGNIFDNPELVEELENECKAKHEKPSNPY